MRDDYQSFRDRCAEIVAIAPHGVAETRRLVEELALPFPVLADDNRAVFLNYDVQSRPWSLGQRPAIYLIDWDGVTRWAYLGSQQWDIPPNAKVVEAIDAINAEIAHHEGRQS